MSEHRCKIFYCDHRKGNYCCFDCPKKCKNRCLNNPNKCGMPQYGRSPREYTPPFDEVKATSLYWEGMSDTKIAKELGVRCERVYYWRKKRGLTANREYKIKRAKAQAMALYNAGLTAEEVSEQIGFTRQSVLRWVKEKNEEREFKC